MLKAVLWDNDGVLVDTERLFFDVNREIFSEHGIELSPRAFFDWFLLDNCGAWHMLRARGYSEARVLEIRSERDKRYGQAIAERDRLVFDGIEAVLETLAPTMLMGLVTSTSRDHLALAHRNTTCLRHFSTVVAEGDCRTSKPSPEPYLLAMERLNVSPCECVAAEDSPRGLLAATAAGIKCIVKRSELTQHYAFGEAYAIVESSDELLAAIEDLRGRMRL